MRAAVWSVLAVVAAVAPVHPQTGPTFRAIEAPHEKVPANISGKEFVYDYKTDTIVVRGNALLTQAHTVLKADELDYTRSRREARAYGHIDLTDPEAEITGSQAELNLEDETGRLFDGEVSLRNGTYHLKGAELTKHIGQHYTVRDGFFTTCGCEGGRPSWSISADQMDVHLGGTGTASDANFNIMGYRVLKLPYLIFPAESERSSGLLGPRLGQSGLRGFQYLQPWYWAIDKSSDATLALDVETKARIGALGEYRLTSGKDDYFWVNGAFMDEQIRDQRSENIVDTQIADPHVPLDRYDLIGMTREHLTPDLTAFADAIMVSDSLYLREMNVWTLSRGYGSNFAVMRAAPSHFGLLDSFEDGFVRLEGTWNQDLIQEQEFALQTLPELLVSGRTDLGNGLAFGDYDLQADNFWRSDGVRGLRLDFNPRITLPWRLGDYLTGYGTVGGRETIYDTSGHDIEVIPVGTNGLENNNGLELDGLNEGGLRTRELIYAGGGVSSEIEKVYDVNWDSIEKIKHTIEPLVTYSFVPNVAQGKLPLYDEVDRVNPRSLLTYGAVSRFFVKIAPTAAPQEETAEPSGDQEGGDESAPQPQGGTSHSATGGYEREIARLSLLQAYDIEHAVTPAGSKLSDMELDASVFPTTIAQFGSSLGYNPDSERITFANVYLALRPPWAKPSPLYMGRAVAGPFLEISYNFVGGNNAAQTFSARAYYELFDRLGIFYAPLYDIAGGKLLSAEYGVRIKSECNCWALDLGISDTTNPNELQFQFQVTLGGLGSVGQSPFGSNPFRNYYGGSSGVIPRLN